MHSGIGAPVLFASVLYMTNGQTALSDLQNDRYPDMHFQRFSDLVARLN